MTQNRCPSSLERNDIGLCLRAVPGLQTRGRMQRHVARDPTEESAMDEYTWSPFAEVWHRSFLCFSRSPLVRRSDRLEAGARLTALIFALLLIAPAAAFGTSVYDQQRQAAARQSVEWHTVDATAVENSSVISRIGAVDFRSHVSWRADGSDHSAWFVGPQNLKSGDRTSVWVNTRGEYVGPPQTRDQVSAAAFGAAAMMWLGLTGSLYLAVQVLHWWLDRTRHAGWAAEWHELDRDGGGRKDHYRK